MSYRLVGEYNGTPLRLLIPAGEALLGSAPECDLHLACPTVSRQHGKLLLDQGVLMVEDLGSSNGSRHNDQPIRTPTVIAAGDQLQFGDVRLTVESVADGDDQIGAAILNDAVDKPAAAAGTTIAPVALDRLAFEQLPGLLRRATAGLSRQELARAIGEAFWRALPLAWIQLSDTGAGEPVLFECGDADQHQAHETTIDQIRLAVAFNTPSIANHHQRLFDLASALLGLADDPPDQPAVIVGDLAGMPEPAPLDPDVRHIYRRAARVGSARINVLIRGESGTGKELMARFIHAQADPESPFVAINCAALASDLRESELFGIEKGVATGVEARPGCFELAHGGTLFLDEIGDMASETQARILRVLQEGEVTRVGGTKVRPAQPRIISATNLDMDQLIGEGKFRLDLLHRIAGWEVVLPPLRERPTDIPNLALYFLARFCRDRGISVRGISRRALDAMRDYHWPGNIRELQQEMHRVSVFLTDNDLLSSNDLSGPIRDQAQTPSPRTLEARLASAERTILKQTLAEANGNISQAADTLGVARSTLYRRMAQLGLHGPDQDRD
jgi:transcriptional regulator with AAA-type ATPase domain